ncbi:MAG: cysteine hydrolase [Ruminococcus sp.]|uniref:cysteine hydrolase family protein n=1 Tax=Ruminococcus sp. TaxID=41978 RepID=UPI001B48DBD8|nr:cysteine hydrolase family protein [Ruminococcus sp.]MBO4493701.1 cysteine hydrolase [Ruminococcus sp.]MBP5430911.1 cysteine hydrolase [Ruminococcus sp.]
MKEALLVIDVQNDYFEGGACPLHEPKKAEERIIRLIAESRKTGRPVIYIKHINSDDEDLFNEGTYGCEISERIAPLPNDIVINKYCPNSFLGTELNDCLRSLGVEKLVVCGMMTHLCIDTTVRAAMDHGYEVALVADACATKDLELNGETIPAETVQKTYIASLSGVFAEII